MTTGQESPFADVNASMFESRREFALYLDSIDPFAEYRERFHIPRTPEGEEMTYLVGNSLGLQPVAVKDILIQELEDWAAQGSSRTRRCHPAMASLSRARPRGTGPAGGWKAQ